MSFLQSSIVHCHHYHSDEWLSNSLRFILPIQIIRSDFWMGAFRTVLLIILLPLFGSKVTWTIATSEFSKSVSSPFTREFSESFNEILVFYLLHLSILFPFFFFFFFFLSFPSMRVAGSGTFCTAVLEASAFPTPVMGASTFFFCFLSCSSLEFFPVLLVQSQRWAVKQA